MALRTEGRLCSLNPSHRSLAGQRSLQPEQKAFPSPTSHSFWERRGHRSISANQTARTEMPAHKAPFFCVSKLTSMNHGLENLNPFQRFWFFMLSMLCSAPQAHINKRAEPSWWEQAQLLLPTTNPYQHPAGTGPAVLSPWDWDNMHKQAEIQHDTHSTTHFCRGPCPFLSWWVHSNLSTRVARLCLE